MKNIPNVNDGSEQVAQGNVPKDPKTEAEKLARDWRTGKANTKDDTFVTESDKANPRTFDEDLAEAGEDNYPHKGNTPK
ncbi:MAG: hypothetical protein EON60_00220 [Alphaproteobacteria bacterium]|nr:MAG: hypothetical protein EON60_00220 [Alphaproteobacteria bacterium]